MRDVTVYAVCMFSFGMNKYENMTSGHKIAAVIRCRNHLTLEITEQASASFLKTLLGVISNAQ